jgi:hypothetical protein
MLHALGLLGVIDWSTLTTGLTTQVEDAFTQALPVLAVIIGGFLMIKVFRRLFRA